jgi:hypothetical protein
MTTLKCIIHGCTFALEGVSANTPKECPVCLREECNRLHGAFEAERADKNALLRAIHIKRAALVVEVPNAPSETRRGQRTD